MEGFNELLVQILGTVVVCLIGAIGTVATNYLAKLNSKLKDESIEKEIITALMAGVADTKENFIIQTRQATEDGKLTKEERQKARQMAIQHATQLLSPTNKDRLLSWTESKTDAYIKKIIKDMDI